MCAWDVAVVTVVLCAISATVSGILVEDPDSVAPFSVGRFHFSDYTFRDVRRVVSTHCPGDLDAAGLGSLELLLDAVDRWSLPMIAAAATDLSSIPLFTSTRRSQLSTSLCSSLLRSPVAALADKEVVYQVSLALDPRNPWVAKNYGFQLEWQGFHAAVDDLLRQVRRWGCFITTTCLRCDLI